jgi:hypothetical protein
MVLHIIILLYQGLGDQQLDARPEAVAYGFQNFGIYNVITFL